MKLLKTRKGFTLIELLVVIGILAVLAAIAIPSVAGLIDRANVSADNTNANEYTNAMERFVSEYELYRQDVASGLIKDTDGDGTPDNMDSAQGRVFNVTGAKSMEDIRALESEDGFNGMRIDIDSKYAQNIDTTRAIIENYTKTSSATYEPKQSDMTYWYNPQTGETIVAPKYENTDELYKRVSTKVKYTERNAMPLSQWIDLASDEVMPEIKIYSIKTGFTQRYNANAILVFWSIPNDVVENNSAVLNNIYVLRGPANEPLNINNYMVKKEISSLLDSDQIPDGEDVKNSGATFLNTLPQNIPFDEWRSMEWNIRLCYEYEEDGIVRHSYSDMITVSYDNLYEQTHLPLIPSTEKFN